MLLVIALAFFTGYLFFKVQNLEKATAPGNVAQQLPQQAAAPGTKQNVSNGHLPVLGNKDAKVTIVEFADFQCPFCKRLHDETIPQIKKTYIDTGKAKLYYRHYAFLGQESTWAAEASECANEQGKFWDYHDLLFDKQGQENSGTFSKDNLKGFAQQLGLNTSQFNDCVDAEKYKKNVSDDLNDGQKLGVNGTPGTFVNGLLVEGAQPFAAFQKTIDQELKK